MTSIDGKEEFLKAMQETVNEINEKAGSQIAYFRTGEDARKRLAEFILEKDERGGDRHE